MMPREVQLFLILNITFRLSELSTPCCGHNAPEKRPGAHIREGRVYPTASLDKQRKEHFFPHSPPYGVLNTGPSKVITLTPGPIRHAES
jgi:hypothetical protein